MVAAAVEEEEAEAAAAAAAAAADSLGRRGSAAGGGEGGGGGGGVSSRRESSSRRHSAPVSTVLSPDGALLPVPDAATAATPGSDPGADQAIDVIPPPPPIATPGALEPAVRLFPNVALDSPLTPAPPAPRAAGSTLPFLRVSRTVSGERLPGAREPWSEEDSGMQQD